MVAPRFLTLASDGYGQFHAPDALPARRELPPLPPGQEADLAPETVWKLEAVKKRKLRCPWREIYLDKHILVRDEIFFF